MKVDTLTSSDVAAVAMDRRILEQLLLMMIVHSLLRKEGTDDGEDALKKMARECMAVNISRKEQSAVSMAQLLVVTERMLDAQLLRLLDNGGEEGREVMSSSDAASEQQLMDADAAAAKKKRAAAKAAKKKRNKRNKAAAKHKKTRLVSWLGGGILPLLMIAALGSITTLIAFSLIHQSDGSSEGEDSPTLPPSASTSLGQRDIQSIIVSPLPVPVVLAVKSPIFSPSVDSDVSRASTCSDTPNWKDKDGYGCAHYEGVYEAGCSGTEKWAGNMGLAADNCCYCGGGSHTLPSTTSSSSICTEDTEGWFDQEGWDCVMYEIIDDPGCPKYGSTPAHTNSAVKGSAIDNCCFCQIDVANNASPTVAPSSSETCVDTLEWRDDNGNGCKEYQEILDPGCPFPIGSIFTGDLGLAAAAAVENCCYCKDPTCEDFTWKCEKRSNTWWTLADQCAEDTRSKKCQVASNVWSRDEASVCDKAASCSCGTDQFKVVTKYYDDDGVDHFNETVGLYNECKCDFWSRRCEDTLGLGEACDYAAEYCCGDYRYDAGYETFNFLNSPQCYCDFYNYAENEFAHKLKPKALNVEEEFSNPCGPFKTYWLSKSGVEKRSLESIYNGTNGQNWTNNVGWMDETVDHCEWYGISCDADGFVTDIDLRDNNLVGQFPIYTRDVDSSGDPILDNT